MFEKLNGLPVFAIIGAIAAIGGIVIGILGLTEPMYAEVTNGKICGYSKIVETTRPHKWKECANPNKVTGYKYHETVSKSSGWVGGGHDQKWHCANVKQEEEKAVGQSIVWSNQKSSEEHHKDFLGHVTYKYHCTIDAKWGPIYQVERWKGCGEADPVTHVIKEPRTCYDTTKRIGWKWRWQ